METLFGRKKDRPRQSSVSVQDLNERSVPYDKLSGPARSSISVTTSNGMMGISAPNTNPALTASGTELNKFTMQRSKRERDRVYELHLHQDSSTTSVSTADSSTLYEDPGLSNKSLPPHPQTARIRRSEASSSPRSQNTDFGQFPYASAYATVRPTSGMTSRSESHRNSKYAASLTSSEPGSHLSHFYHRHQNSETFDFSRPQTDEEIEVLFENVKRTRDLGDIPNLPIEQKWQMVYNDEHIRWREERQREEQSRRQNETGQPAAIIAESPEWYVKKFLDKTITAKQAGSLLVSLRSKELRYEG
jgi:cytokinesis protein